MTERPSTDLGPLLPSLVVRPPGPVSRSLADRLRAVESRDVTHLSERGPVFWSEARGANVRDVDGNVYLDLTSAFGVALLGHAPPVVLEAISAQAGRLLHGMGDVHPPAVKVELLEWLARHAPWPGARAVLGSGGAEAVEVALKTAHLATGRPGILAFEGSYHGLTLGALAATQMEHFRAPFRPRIYPGVAFAPFPDPLREGPDAGSRALEQVEALLGRGAPDGSPIGALIVEPIQGRGGLRIPPEGFMAALRPLAAAHGAVVIADEVFTGSGRCGSLLASERVGLEPDLVCLGKALGGGVPISACLGRADLMDAWPPSSGEAIHTSTFLGHPLGCAAALAVLRSWEEDGLAGQVEARGTALRMELQDRLDLVDRVGEVRGLGLLVGIELVQPGTLRPEEGAAVRVAEALLGEGVFALPAGARGHVLELAPPLTLTEGQRRFAVEAIGRSVEDTPSRGQR